MKLEIYQIDAFTKQPFSGNPAAVCPLQEWLADDILQNIAEENNLSETAFFAPEQEGFRLRWFTPAEEVDLCGHATLAAAYVLYVHLQYSGSEIVFYTRSGNLRVKKAGDGFCMDFPAVTLRETAAPPRLLAGLDRAPTAVLAGFDYIVVLERERDVLDLLPDFTAWLELDLRGVVVTAPGEEVDFVSRCFFPKLRVNEDPVTGSAHCELAPFWGAKLGIDTLLARQLSHRTGDIKCRVLKDRVLLYGSCADYMQGRINLT